MFKLEIYKRTIFFFADEPYVRDVPIEDTPIVNSLIDKLIKNDENLKKELNTFTKEMSYAENSSGWVKRGGKDVGFKWKSNCMQDDNEEIDITTNNFNLIFSNVNV